MRKILKNKKKIIAMVALVTASLTTGIVYAAFSDKSKVLGTSFSVGNSDIKMYSDVKLGVDPTNLVEELQGPQFTNVSPYWKKDHLIKIYNNATQGVSLSSNANYETANDPAELRSIIFVEPIEWNDNNFNGTVETGEEGTSYGRKTIIKWKTEGYNLGQIPTGQTKSLILRFSTDVVSDTKQGAVGTFTFEFDAIQGAQ